MGMFRRHNFFKDLLYLALILILSILICLPLFKGKFICSDDYAWTLTLLLSMKQSLGHGQWLVRWVPDLYYGYGYPVFNFYAYSFYLLGTLITYGGADIVQAVNISLFIVVFLSGCSMYLFARALWGKEGGLVSAVAYLFAPYHIVDLYLRGAASEAAAFVVLPLILWSFYKLEQTSRKRYFFCAATSCAGLLLTHNCTSVIFFPLVPAYLLMLYWPFFSYQRLVPLLKSFGAMALGVGMAAFFWLPALIEKKFVHTDTLVQGNADFHRNFVFFHDLIAPLWAREMPWFGDPHSYCRIGPAHYLMVLIVLMGTKKILRQEPRLKAQLLFFFLILAYGIFFTLPYSTFIWEHVQTLKYLQFPCRFLTIVVLAVSAIAGGFVLLWDPKHRCIVALSVLLVMVGANFYYCHPRDSFICDLRMVKTDPDQYLSKLCSQDTDEFIPIWVKDGVKRLVGTEALRSISEGGEVIETDKISPLHYKFKVAVLGEATFYFHSFYYPGWTVRIDNKPTEIIKDNPYGLIFFKCPGGAHNVEVYFGTIPSRQIAQGISVAALILLVFFCVLC